MTNSNPSPRTAVVLGGSIAGLFAAAALARHLPRVLIVDRDDLVTAAGPRRGVPQARHPHSLSTGATADLEELLPGILDDLRSAGATVSTNLARYHFEINGHPFVVPEVEFTPHSYQARRGLLEDLVRARVLGLPQVEVVDPSDIVDLVGTDGRVHGVVVAPRRPGSSLRTVAADLVVDATGRGSRTPTWLAANGYAAPEVDEVKVDIVYTSQDVSMPRDALAENLVLVSASPTRPTGCALIRAEHDTWSVMVYGYGGRAPEQSFAGVLDGLRSLVPEHVVGAVAAATPLAETQRFRYPASRWHRYDRLRRMPQGLVVLGDAVAGFNPIYGQGMTSALRQALVLGDWARAGAADPRRFQRKAAKPIGDIWQLATGADLASPFVDGEAAGPAALVGRYIGAVQTAAEVDPEVARRFSRVIGLTDPAAGLLSPTMMLRVARGVREQRRRSAVPAVPGRSSAVSR